MLTPSALPAWSDWSLDFCSSSRASWLFRGGFLVWALSTAVFVARPRSTARRRARRCRCAAALRRHPLVRHLPVALADLPGAAPRRRPRVARLAGRVPVSPLTFGAAELSYRYVEMPVRRGASAGSGPAWGRRAAWAPRPGGPGGRRDRRPGDGARGGLTVPASPPCRTRSERLTRWAPGSLSGGGGAATAQAPLLLPRQARERPVARPAPPAAPPAKPKRNDTGTASTTAVGDSVMLAANAALDTDPRGHRRRGREPAARGHLRPHAGRRSSCRLGDVVVIGAGTNGRIRRPTSPRSSTCSRTDNGSYW